MAAMNYTRKRALLACDFCRHRKRRCDGERPCSTCRESNADCRYKDLPVERVEPAPGSGEAVTEQLNRIESLLQSLVYPSSGVSDAPEASEPKTTYTLTDTSPPVSVVDALVDIDDAHSRLSLLHQVPYDPYHQSPFADYTQTPLPYQDSITTSTGTNNAPIISLSPAPPAVPLVSAMSMSPIPSMSPMASISSLTIASASTPPIPSISPISPISQPSAFDSRLSPDYAFAHAYHLGYNFVASTPTGSPSDSSSLQHTVPVQAQLEQQHQHQQHEQESQFAIPREESTAADSLLSMPEIKFLISRLQSSNNGKDNTNDTKDAAPTPTPVRRRPDLPLSRTHFYDIEARLPLQKELHLFHSSGLWNSTWPLSITDPAITDKISIYVAAYFARVYPNTPLVNIGQYAELSKGMFDASEAGSDISKDDCHGHSHDYSIQKAICLTIWAIGALVAGGPSEKDSERDSLLYFQSALKIIQHHALWDFGPPSLAVSQALLLAASFFAHIGRPLYNARLVHLAGRQLLKLHYLEARGSFDAERQRDFCIAFWVCFLWESDRVAEFDVPLSGITKLSADMPLPNKGETDDSETMIYLTAEIAARKISNQTRDCLYRPLPVSTAAASTNSTVGTPPPMSDVDMIDALTSTQPHKRRRGDDDSFSLVAPRSVPPPPSSSSASISKLQASTIATTNKLLSDSTELNRQLNEWYRMIPEHVQPPLQGNVFYSDAGNHRINQSNQNNRNNRPSINPIEMQLLPVRAQILRAQYYAIRHIIHRPFVLAVAQHQKQSIEVRERRNNNFSSGAKRNRVHDETEHLPPAILEKCAICVDSCLMFLIHVLPLLDHRSPYLWSFCQFSVACLVVLLVVQACPPMHAANAARHSFEGGRSRKISIARLRDEVAKKLSRWATEGSSFEAELHLIQSLPMPASDSIVFMIPAGLALARDSQHLSSRHESIKRE